jgi:hypothetical protein
MNNSLSITHHSRGRAQIAHKTAMKWILDLSLKYKWEYIMSVDETDPILEEYISNSKDAPYILIVNDNKTSIEAMNVAASKTQHNLIVTISDDVDCFPNWDEWLMVNLEGKEDFVVKTWDGIQSYLITMPILDRKYYNRFNYIAYPGYKHLFSDNEFTEVAHILGKVIDLQDWEHMFKHNHPIMGVTERDSIYDKNNSSWNQGENLFNERKQMNYGL